MPTAEPSAPQWAGSEHSIAAAPDQPQVAPSPQQHIAPSSQPQVAPSSQPHVVPPGQLPAGGPTHPPSFHQPPGSAQQPAHTGETAAFLPLPPSQIITVGPQPVGGQVPQGLASGGGSDTPFPQTKLARALFWCGVVELLLALACVALEAASISVYNSAITELDQREKLEAWSERKEGEGALVDHVYYYRTRLPLTFIGAGIWVGLLTIVSASFGMAAGRAKRTCTAVTAMVLTIIMAVVTICVIGTASAVLSDLERFCSSSITHNNYQGRYAYVCDEARGFWNSLQGLQGLLILCGCLLFVLDVTTAALCMKAVCGRCCKSSNPPPQASPQYVMMYSANGGAYQVQVAQSSIGPPSYPQPVYTAQPPMVYSAGQPYVHIQPAGLPQGTPIPLDKPPEYSEIDM